MPHLIIEHSKDISLKKDFKSLVADLHANFAKQETVRLSAVKSRTIMSDNVIVGEELKSEFLFLKVLLLPGRTVELKQKFVEILKDIILKHIFEEKCSFCIEIAELEHYYTQG